MQHIRVTARINGNNVRVQLQFAKQINPAALARINRVRTEFNRPLAASMGPNFPTQPIILLAHRAAHSSALLLAEFQKPVGHRQSRDSSAENDDMALAHSIHSSLAGHSYYTA